MSLDDSWVADNVYVHLLKSQLWADKMVLVLKFLSTYLQFALWLLPVFTHIDFNLYSRKSAPVFTYNDIPGIHDLCWGFFLPVFTKSNLTIFTQDVLYLYSRIRILTSVYTSYHASWHKFSRRETFLFYTDFWVRFWCWLIECSWKNHSRTLPLQWLTSILRASSSTIRLLDYWTFWPKHYIYTPHITYTWNKL